LNTLAILAGLGEQAKAVIDLLWKFSSPFISDGLTNFFVNMLIAMSPVGMAMYPLTTV
jgi:hypothetical protein